MSRFVSVKKNAIELRWKTSNSKTKQVFFVRTVGCRWIYSNIIIFVSVNCKSRIIINNKLFVKISRDNQFIWETYIGRFLRGNSVIRKVTYQLPRFCRGTHLNPHPHQHPDQQPTTTGPQPTLFIRYLVLVHFCTIQSVLPHPLPDPAISRFFGGGGNRDSPYIPVMQTGNYVNEQLY